MDKHAFGYVVSGSPPCVWLACTHACAGWAHARVHASPPPTGGTRNAPPPLPFTHSTLPWGTSSGRPGRGPGLHRGCALGQQARSQVHLAPGLAPAARPHSRPHWVAGAAGTGPGGRPDLGPAPVEVRGQGGGSSPFCKLRARVCGAAAIRRGGTNYRDLLAAWLLLSRVCSAVPYGCLSLEAHSPAAAFEALPLPSPFPHPTPQRV